MEEKSKNTEKSRDKRIDNLKPFKKGKSGNPKGRSKGQRNYATIYREALIKIAEVNNKTPEEIETMMEEAGIKNALKGNFQFWKDIRDRIHGTATQKHDHTTGGQPLPQQIAVVYKEFGDEDSTE